MPEKVIDLTNLNSKPFYQSKALWGVFIMVLSSTLQYYKVDISGQEQDLLAEAIVDAISGVSLIVGTVLAVIGRFKAQKALVIRKEPSPNA